MTESRREQTRAGSFFFRYFVNVIIHKFTKAKECKHFTNIYVAFVFIVLNVRQLERSLERCNNELEKEKSINNEEKETMRKQLQSSEREKNILIGNYEDMVTRQSSLRDKPVILRENGNYKLTF